MKQIFAITLLIIHLFNTTGYNLFFNYEMNRADKEIVSNIDKNNFNNEDLVQIKLPLSMPYLTNHNLERIDGQVEYNGIKYNYVKRKISNDTLYIFCLPNTEKTQLSIAKSDFTKNINDTPPGKKDTSSLIKKGNITSEYTVVNDYRFTKNTPAAQINSMFSQSKPESVFLQLQTQPPDIFC